MIFDLYASVISIKGACSCGVIFPVIKYTRLNRVCFNLAWKDNIVSGIDNKWAVKSLIVLLI